MALSIRTNVASLNAQRNLSASQGATESAMSRLSSGMRITKASDDAAGLAISSKMQAQIRSYNQAARNANDGLSMIQTAEAALNTTTNLLTRLKELATQAASGTLQNADRTLINNEATQLTAEIDRNAAAAKFNGVALLDGATAATTFQVGINATAGESQITVDFRGLSAKMANLGGVDADGSNPVALAVNLSTQAGAQAALTSLDTAIEKVSGARATLGAAGNRFQAAVENIQTFSESLSAANSRIRDVDVAEESANLARANVLQQAGISVLAQANQSPQMALKLLG
jgi:flagellin